MFDDLDPITADGPSRNIGPEEDLEAFKANVAETLLERPIVELDDGDVVGRDLVVLSSALGECLASFLVDGAPAGRITYNAAASTSALEGTGSALGCKKMASRVYRGRHGATVIVGDVAPERAVAWTSGVFEALAPTSVVVVSGIAGFNFRGAFDGESTEHGIFCLHVNKGVPAVAPLLPNTSLLDGIGAAVMLQAECDGVPASAVVAVELTRSPREDVVCSVGDTLVSLLQDRRLVPDEAAMIKKACAAKYAASADLSVYV